ncbi:MAG: Hsp20/alpha crystallin family protein [Gammaproteobacteria bacterium]
MSLPLRNRGAGLPAGIPSDITGGSPRKATAAADQGGGGAPLIWLRPVPMQRPMANCGQRSKDMTLIRWEPIRELDDFFARCSPYFGRLHGGRLASAAGETTDGPAWAPVANISETENEYLIKAELPEVRKEDVKVTVDDGVITLSGERRHEVEHKDEKVHRTESFYGNFTRSFRLPEDADVAGIQAESKNGILKVRVPKTPAARARTIEVQVN